MKQTEKLRQLIAREGAVIAPCAYDALTARIIETSGFELIGTTGYGMHGAILGSPDNGLLTFNEMLSMCENMASVVELPIMADAEGGYGNAINTYRTVREFERAGVAGLFIEDQKLPPNCPFLKETETISVEEMCGKIRAAVDARRDPNFVIVARTDAPLEEAIERAEAYREAGADMIKIVPKTRAELEMLPGKVKLPLHLGFTPGKEINKGLTAKDAGEMGYKIVTFPVTALFAGVFAIKEALKVLREQGTDDGLLEKMVTFDDYFEVVNVDKFRDMDRKYLLKK